MRGWPLRRILGSLFVVAGVVTVLIVALVVTALIRLDQARTDRVEVFGPALLTIESLAKSYSDQETGLRGYVITKKPALRAPYDNGRAEERKQLRDLRRQLRRQDDLLVLVDRVQTAAGTWRTQVAEPLIAGTATEPDSTKAADIEAGKQQFDALRKSLAVLRRPVRDARDASSRTLDQQAELLRVVLGASLLLLLVVAGLTAAALRRFITDPLGRLGREVDLVEAGDLNHAVEIGAAPAEIQLLTRQVDGMRLRIVQEYALAENSRKEAIDARLQVEEQAVDLLRSNTELEQFAYVASHDLQEPLRKIASFCQLLERRYKGQLDERADQYIEFAVDGAKRMQQLINDLLAFSRVGRLATEFSDVDLEASLAQALRQLDSSIEEAGATVTHDPLPTVSGDTTLLVQLFQNLIGNSVKFRGAQAPAIRLGAHRAGDDWEFFCADNGIGVDQQYADKIFVIFQRLHGRDAYGGTGIGLAMCKKIVEYHGGRMWLDHDVDDGATFRWTMPVRAADLDPAGIAGGPAGGSAESRPPVTPDGTSTDGTSTDGTSTDGTSTDGLDRPSTDERTLDERVPAHPADRGSPGGGRPG